MLIVKVKICGITNYDDALAAMEMGADLLGFNFYSPSPRYISVERAAQIVARLPAFIPVVGVFVNASFGEIRAAVKACHLDWVQLHGDETPEFCDAFRADNISMMKVIRVRDRSDILKADEYATDAILLDAYHPDIHGGTGFCFDWSLIDHTPMRIFLAGGIRPENAAQAVQLGVYGIDVCSGIEASPGKKDPVKMKALFEAIRHLRG